MKAVFSMLLMLLAANAAGQGTCPGGVCPAPGTHVPGSGSGVRRAAPPPANVCRISHRQGNATCYGSGTLVASDAESSYLLTCFHLFRDGAGEIAVVFPGTSPQPGRLVASDPAHDVAIVRTQRIAAVPVTLSRGDPRGILRTGGYGSGVYGEASGPVVGYATAKGAEYRSLRIAAIVEEGDSGGPVFDSRGELAAVVWGELNGEAYATYGIPVWRLVERATAESQRVEKPVVAAPSPQPVAPPITGPVCNCGEQWRGTSEQLSAIHKQLSGLESRIAALAVTLQHEPSLMPLPSEPSGPSIPWLQIASIALGISGPAGIGIAAAGALVMWRKGKQRRGRGGPRPRRFQPATSESTE